MQPARRTKQVVVSSFSIDNGGSKSALRNPIYGETETVLMCCSVAQKAGNNVENFAMIRNNDFQVGSNLF